MSIHNDTGIWAGKQPLIMAELRQLVKDHAVEFILCNRWQQRQMIKLAEDRDQYCHVIVLPQLLKTGCYIKLRQGGWHRIIVDLQA